MQRLRLVLPIVVVLAVAMLTAIAARVEPQAPVGKIAAGSVPDLDATVARVDAALEQTWTNAGLDPAPEASELQVLRRLSLALHGTIPSLEEIRQFEADEQPDRLRRWTAGMLQDPRFADYFAERLARSYVGTEMGQFLVFRRDRFTHWLSEELHKNTPYDEIVRQMVGGQGIWTGEGEVNFITSGFANDEFDSNKLAARAARAFLGQRIDCAQCHDHPFDHWKQEDFEGLAAHFGQVRLTLSGVVDDDEKAFKVEDRLTTEERVVEPRVPFGEEWLPSDGGRRENLAAWITHAENKRFERAIANRVWGLMFGRPFLSDRPVDDLPDPDDAGEPDALDILGSDFREHGCDLRRLIQVIAASQAFRLDSRHPLAEQLQDPDLSPDRAEEVGESLDLAEQRWAVFPLVRLRPEQVIGAMLQANNLHTIDQNSHLFVRAMRYFREQDFVNEFGDAGSEELDSRPSTISQALLRMNGKLARELTETNPFFAPGRVLVGSPTPEAAMETIYLVSLTRRPSAAERDYFLPGFEKRNQRNNAVTDLFWVLFNSPEFSWNH